MKNLTEDLAEMNTSIMDWIIISKSSPHKRDSPKSQYFTTVLRANKKSFPLEVRHSTKLVACGFSNMISAHQNCMNYSTRQNSKETLIWTSRTSTITSRYVSMQLLDSMNTFFLLSYALWFSSYDLVY